MLKTLEERYTREQTLKIALISHTHDFGYSSVVFLDPQGFQSSLCGDFTESYYDLKAVYLKEIWQEAKKRTDKKFFAWDQTKWYYNPDDYFQKLIFDGYKREDAISFFWDNLEKIADSGEITVQESFSQTTKEKIWIINSIGNKIKRGYHPNISEIIEKPVKKSWRWNDIKDFFLELADDELAFLHGINLNQCCTRDFPLFDACERLDISGIKDAISSGAVINAIDKSGNGCLAYVLNQDRYLDDNYPCPKNSSENQKIKDTIDLLIDNGLNINLYGFEWPDDAVLLTHWMQNPDLMQFVIDRGADVNLNPFCTDLGDSIQNLISSATYDYVTTDLAIGDYDTVELLEEKRILEAAGVKYWIDGWDGDKVSKFYDDLWNKIIYD